MANIEKYTEIKHYGNHEEDESYLEMKSNFRSVFDIGV